MKISDEDEHNKNNNKNNDIKNTGLLSSLDEENVLYYNMQKAINCLIKYF